MPAHPDERAAGFTLIEILVTLVVIGILTAISVPVFLQQRQKGELATLKADLRSGAIAAESWYADGYTNGDATDIASGFGYAYMSSNCDTSIWPRVCEGKTAGFPSIRTTPGTGLGVHLSPVTNQGYCVVGVRTGTPYLYGAQAFDGLLYYDSLLGGIRTRADLTTAGACQKFR